MKDQVKTIERTLAVVNKYLSRKKDNNSSYSNRAFARDLELSPSYVSELLRGKKLIPYKQIEKFISVLDIDQADAAEIKLAYSPDEYIETYKKNTSNKSVMKNWKLNSRKQLNVLHKWYHIPMIDLVTCKNFDGDFANAFNISNEEADIAVDYLEEVGLIAKVEGRYQKTDLKLQFFSKDSRDEFKNYHSQLLEKSLEELEKREEEDYKKRLIISSSVAIDNNKVEYFKKRLSDFMQELSAEMSSDDCNQVYHFGMQFHPLSKDTKE